MGWKIQVGAADYLERNDVSGQVFCTYAAGAYLVYRMYPDLRVGMDSRNHVYGEELYADYARALVDPHALRAMLSRLDAVAIVLEWAQPGMVGTAAMIHQLDGWRPVFFDDAAVVYMREAGRRADLARRDGYLQLDPALYRPGTLQPEEIAAALRESERADRQGSGYVGRVMRIEALAAAGRWPEAEADEQRILDEAPPMHHIYAFLGLWRLARGERQAAVHRFRRALALNPGSPGALHGMRLAGRGAGR